MSETLPPLTDERTAFLDLLLPSLDNWQEQDVPRLRESLVLLDTALQLMSLDLGERPTGPEFLALSQAVAARLPLAGGTLTGPLVLAGAPTADLHPATRKYVDEGAGGRIRRRVVTAAETVAPEERGNLLDCDGSFALSFPDVAQLGNGWWCRVRNIGTGGVPLSAYAGQLLDGLAGYVMYPKECRLVICHGGALVSIVLCAFNVAWATSGDFVAPPGYAGFDGDGWSGGGGGGGSAGSSLGAGGGQGGNYLPIRVRTYTPGATYPYVVGAGGAGGVHGTGPTAGSAGGATSIFGESVAGGAGGNPSTSGTVSGTGGGTGRSIMELVAPGNTAVATLGASTIYSGAPGGGGGASGQPTPPRGGNSVYGAGGGGAGGGTVTSGSPSMGGTSSFAGGGATGAAAGGVAAGAAATPGGGGGGGGRGAAATPSAGARGEIRMWGVV